MSEYRFIFPSYDWDDVGYVNQIIKVPEITGAREFGFKSGVPLETIKLGDAAVKKWIDENMKGCSCLILFQGEKTSESEWARYEITKAINESKPCFIIDLNGLMFNGKKSLPGEDPFQVAGLYLPAGETGYIIKRYVWAKETDPFKHIHDWIEDACERRISNAMLR